MIFLNQLLYQESYKEEDQGIYFWVNFPPTHQQREKVREKLPEDIGKLLDKVPLSCEKHITQEPVTMRGKNGIFVSYVIEKDDVLRLCKEQTAKETSTAMEKAVFDWLRDVASYGEAINLAGDMNAEIIVGCGTRSSENEIGLFIPSDSCSSCSFMEQVADRLVRFMEQEYQNCLRIKTRAGRLILLRDDEKR